MNVRDKEITVFDGGGSIYIDGAALAQLYEAMTPEWAIKGALMPDAHKGYGLPIGGVVATKGMIVPSFIGYDIGCGVCAIQIRAKKKTITRHRNEIFDNIYEAIPTGAGKYNNGQKLKDWSEYENIPKSAFLKELFEEKRGFDQLCSLGSGNHFIEVGYDDHEDENIWVIIHSGSRGIGHKTATHYMRIAGGGKCREGTYPLDVDSQDGQDYITDLNFCLHFALENRKQMLSRTVDVIARAIGNVNIMKDNIINRNHNHAEFKDGLWIHRKGATHAEKGMYGVIPGNMKDGAFIVIGKGNEKSMCSSSHGAGRVSSRNKAKETLSLDEFMDDMEGIAAKVGKSTLDESKGAYKNIFEVMKAQDDLVEVVRYVKPIINVKA